jgi:hypothetical protein
VLLIEGLGQQAHGGLNWGDGLITDRDTIARGGLSDPNPFFQELLTKPYRRQVIAAVHVYPPAISKVLLSGVQQLPYLPARGVPNLAHNSDCITAVFVCRQQQQ